MGRKLKDIKLGEVSLVDKAANQKTFLFFKQDSESKKPANAGSKKLKKKINIVIDSDGTVGGTKISVNKDALDNLRDFSFYFYGGDDDTKNISCSYSKVVEADDGFKRSETFYLSKGDLQMDGKIKEQLEAYFGKDTEVDFEKAEETTDVVSALSTINDFRGDFPDDLKQAVGVIAKQSGFCDTVISKIKEKQDNKDTTVDKTGAKHSKETMKKITDALAALKSLMPELTEKSDKTADKNDQTDMQKAIDGITKSIEELEKNNKDASEDALTKALKGIAERLAVVEKSTGIKKSIIDQDNDSDKDSGLWPSFSGQG